MTHLISLICINIFSVTLSLENQHNSSPDLYIAVASFHGVNNMADFKNTMWYH